MTAKLVKECSKHRNGERLIKIKALFGSMFILLEGILLEFSEKMM